MLANIAMGKKPLPPKNLIYEEKLREEKTKLKTSQTRIITSHQTKNIVHKSMMLIIFLFLLSSLLTQPACTQLTKAASMGKQENSKAHKQ